nr:hypothetical protein LRH_11457 [Lacticaseibacillus rhamnosus HN001]
MDSGAWLQTTSASMAQDPLATVAVKNAMRTVSELFSQQVIEGS